MLIHQPHESSVPLGAKQATLLMGAGYEPPLTITGLTIRVPRRRSIYGYTRTLDPAQRAISRQILE